MKDEDVCTPIVKDLVLVGGHSHGRSEAVRDETGAGGAVDADLPRCTHTLFACYRAMSPGTMITMRRTSISALARFANARFYHSAVTGLDLNGKRVLCDNRPPVPFELLDYAGSTPTSLGATGNVVLVKPINNFLDRWEALSARAMSQEGPMRIAVVGAGASGVEILLAIQHGLGRLRAAAGKPPDNIEFHLFSNTEHRPPTTRRSAPPS